MVDFVHEALLYRGEGQFLAGTVPFVRDGLAAGEPVLVAVPGRGVDLLRSALGGHADDVEFVDIRLAGRNPGRIIPGVLSAFADTARGAPVRIVDEPVWAGRSALEYPACVQHEALVNAVFEHRPAWIMCPYDASALASDVLRDAESTHPVVLDDRGRRPSHGYREPFLTAGEFNLPLPPPPADAVSGVFDRSGLADVRRLVAESATAWGLSDEQVGDLVLAVNELATNSVVHADGGGTVLLWPEGASVVCEVRDRGRLADPMVGRTNPGRHAHGGFGVMLVNLLCDLVRLHTTHQGTAIRVYMG